MAVDHEHNMQKNVGALKQAYDFYQKVKQDEEAMSCGCLCDAEKWLWKELDALFKKEDDKMDTNTKLDLKEEMNVSINLMMDCLSMLDTGDLGATLQMWQLAIDKAKGTKIRMVRVAKENNDGKKRG